MQCKILYKLDVCRSCTDCVCEMLCRLRAHKMLSTLYRSMATALMVPMLPSTFITATCYFCLRLSAHEQNGKQLSSIMVSVVFHTLRVAKRVPRLRAHRATSADREKKAAVPRAFMAAYPSQRSSHAVYTPLCSLAATVVPELH